MPDNSLQQFYQGSKGTFQQNPQQAQGFQPSANPGPTGVDQSDQARQEMLRQKAEAATAQYLKNNPDANEAMSAARSQVAQGMAKQGQ